MNFCVKLLSVLLVLVMLATTVASCAPQSTNRPTTPNGTTSNNVVVVPPVTGGDDNGNNGDDNNDGGNTGNTPVPPVEVPDVNISAPVTPDAENKVPEGGVNLSGDSASATIPGGVQMEEGATELTLTIDGMEKSEADLELLENEISTSFDVHMAGISKENLVPMIITLTEATAKGLNSTSIRLYHVENGETLEMTRIANNEEFTSHNQFKYDPATGDVTLYIASFSEIAIVNDIDNAWEGNFDYTWYDASKTELNIANADQLAAFGAIVGGMAAGIEQDSFSGKTVTLLADINLGDAEADNNPDIIFYPIGYNSDDGLYEKTGVAVSTGFYNFCGTFDGTGHTIANFYHNTWEMKGDNNYYDAALQYYRDGMGLFGRVYGGTIKNLTVSNFSSDGEYTTTGVIAAYADGATFENISIFNCNPRVYNIGNGGIVGCVGWYAKEAGLTTTFKNITVDNSNKISALWGSYDVACGGIVGQYYPTSGQSSVNYPVNAGISFENCHISAQMDVYNDVCANYQYYAYRYTGMLIGSVRENVTIDGRVYPKMDGITAKDCTIHFGTWNDYYYCEIIDNTTASYTHDYQMSRLTEIKAIDGTTITYLDGTTGTVPASGRANYVIVDYTKGHGTENATCYHFKDGAVWTHDMGGIQEGIDENGDGQDDLKEDKQHIYLEFNNLVTGYGWGVTTKAVGDLAGVTILDRETGNSVEKFEGKVDTLTNNRVYTFADLFNFVDKGVELVPGALTIGITKVNATDTVSATIDYKDRSNWEDMTISFTGTGTVQITIQDYYFCVPTTITVEITEHEHEYDNACDATCNLCQATREVEDHVYDNDCDAACNECGATREIGEHVYDNACDANCNVCGETREVGEHNPGDAATCTTAQTCTICGAVLVAAKGHTEVVDKAVAPTCTTTGLTEGKHCSVCNEVLVAQTVVDKLGHTLGENATCTTAQTCTVCGVELVAALGHSYNSVVTAPTCTKAGYTTHTCTRCNDTYTNNPTEALGHIKTNFTGDFLYRVGNKNAVDLSSLFNVEKHTVTVSGTNVAGNASVTVEGTTLTFTGTGVVKVTLTPDCSCDECTLTLNLEVVDAINATSATSATKNNVVLLNDCGFSSLEVSGGYTLYGNGFTMTCSSDSVAIDRTYSFVTLNNGTLDNVQIIVPNFSHAILYESNKTEGGNPSNTDSSGRTRYYNIRSAVLMTGNSKISNSYVSGGRVAVYITTGNHIIDNSTIVGGAAANIQVEATATLKMKDIVLIQKPTQATVHDTSKTLMGVSVILMCDTSGIGAPITLEGTIRQYAWANADYKVYVPSDAQSFVSIALQQTDYVHSITYEDGVTRDSINLGIIYMPGGTTASKTEGLSDNRTASEQTSVPYAAVQINGLAYIYSYTNTNGTHADVQTVPTYTPNKQGIVIPVVNYTDTNENRVFNTTYDEVYGMWKSTLKVDVDAGEYTFDFSKLLVQKFGNNLTYTVKTPEGDIVDINSTITLNQAVSNVYYLTITDNQVYDVNGNLTGEVNEITYMFELLSTKTSLPAPTWTSTTLNGTPYIVVDSKGGDWNCAVPVLDGLKIKYWSKKQNKEVELDLANVVTAAGLSKGLQNGSNNTITITVADEYTLTITTTGFKTNDNGKPVVLNGKLYFTVSSSSNYVSTSTTSRTPNISYTFTDANNSNPITLDTSFNVVYATYKGTQYKYSDFCNGDLKTASSCVTGDTLVTLADGTQKRIDQVTTDDMLLVWNHFTGNYEAVPAAIIFNHGYDNNTVIKLNFSDGTQVKVINLHQFFDADLNKYVSIDATSVADYVGHGFVKQSGDSYTTVTLDSYEISEEYIEAYGIISALHYNILVEGMFSTDFMVEDYDLFNYFAFGEGMMFDEEMMKSDIEKYGLYTYEDFADYLTYEQFVGFNVQYFKIAVGKGLYTYDGILDLIDEYLNN